MNDPAAARAWSWVAHLRAGGATPWSGWTDRPPTAGAGGRPSVTSSPATVAGRPGPRVLPGAQQLELLRRVNAAGVLPAAARDRVLAASGLDRGLADLPLPGGPRTAFGPAPVDPADVPVEELLRVGVLLLADALPGVVPEERAEELVAEPGLGAAGRGGSARVRLRRLAHGGYRVVGDPWLAARVREDLRRRGRPPGGRRPRVAVLAGPVPAMLAHTWTHRVWHDGAAAWPDWVAARANGPLPWGADVAGQADAWAARVGTRRVVVVTDPAEVGRLAGVRRRDLGQDLAAGGGLDPGGDATELARRVRGALCVVAPPHRHRTLLLRGLLPATEGVGRAFPPPLPPEHAGWAARRAGRQYRRLRGAGYAVAGDADLLLLGADVVPDGPDQDTTRPEHVLDLAVALLARGLVPGTGAEDGPAHPPDRAVDQGGQGA